MADPRDDRVASAYRQLPGDGPPPALDAAIQAAARRAAGSRPGGARRWQVPVSIAAVLALAIGVSLQVDREKPVVADGTPVSSGSAEYPVSQAEPEREERPASQAASPAGKSAPNEVRQAPAKEPQQAPETKRFAPDPRRDGAPSLASSPAPVPPPVPAAASAPVAVPAPSPARAPATLAAPPVAAGATIPDAAVRASPQAIPRAKSEATRDMAQQEKPLAEAPERQLERIAELRGKGLHDEADRALAEFRRAYPAYRISEEWLRKVERK